MQLAKPRTIFGARILPAVCLLMVLGAAGAHAQPQDTRQAKPPGPVSAKNQSASAKMVLEPRAMALLKAASERLAAAKSMSFTAVASYEYPSQLGPPILYTVRYDVAMQRPDKLRVIIPGDGPASEFYYDGKSMMAYAPAENLVAVADAPPTIDGTLKAAFETADIYYPFTDLLVADPYAAMADGAILAFYIGPSGMVGGTKTEMLAWANPRGIPADLDRRRRQTAAPSARGIQRRPAGLRHELDLSNWQIDAEISADAFTSEKAKSAPPMKFDRPAQRVRSAWPEAAWEHKADQGCDGPASSEVTLIRGDVMKTIVAMAGALLLGVLWQDPAGAWASANRYGGSTSHSLGRNQPHQRLRWQLQPFLRPGHRAHQCLRWKQRARIRRRDGAYQRLWRQHVWRLWPRGHAYLFLRGDGLSPARTVPRPMQDIPPITHLSLYRITRHLGCNGCAAAAGAIVGVTAGVAAGVAVVAAAVPTTGSPCAGCLCGFACRMRLPTLSPQIRLRRHVASTRVRRERRLLPARSWAVISALSLNASDQDAASGFDMNGPPSQPFRPGNISHPNLWCGEQGVVE